MTPSQEALLDKARRSLEAARLLQNAGEFDFATSRAYYSMFYVAQGILFERGLSFSKHSAVIAMFGRELRRQGSCRPTCTAI